MALVTLAQLRDILSKHRDWAAEGYAAAEDLVAIELTKGTGADPVINMPVDRKTRTYEGRDATLVLDFDEQGFLITIEIV